MLGFGQSRNPLAHDIAILHGTSGRSRYDKVMVDPSAQAAPSASHEMNNEKAIAIVHTDQSCPGAVGVMLHRQFKRVQVIRPACGDRLPDVGTIAGPVVVFGGPMGVHDVPRLDWLAMELDWIGQCIARGVRMVGVCLGAQLIARSSGHGIVSCADGALECGYYPIQAEGGVAMPQWAYQWHRNGIVPSAGARLPMQVLARSEWTRGVAVQAFRVGSAMGLQFHPEVTTATIRRWIARDWVDLGRPGCRPAHQHLADHARHMPAMRQWVDEDLSQWLCGHADVDGHPTR